MNDRLASLKYAVKTGRYDVDGKLGAMLDELIGDLVYESIIQKKPNLRNHYCKIGTLGQANLAQKIQKIRKANKSRRSRSKH